MNPDKPLIRIVDDDPFLRDSLEFMLKCEGYDVISFADPKAFLAGDMPSRLGCVILDVRMPGMSGLELQEILTGRAYECPIIFLTAHGDIDMAVQTMRDGACDFQQKPIKPATFLPAISRAIEKDRARRGGATNLLDELKRFRSLSEREKEIAEKVAQGFTSQQIAEQLGISKRTVDHYRMAALTKIELRTPAELAGFFERIRVFLASHESQTF